MKFHPADMGTTLAALPRSGRNFILRVMDPGAVASMLRQMNPLQTTHRFWTDTGRPAPWTW